MGRAEQRIGIRLDAEYYVPDHVTHPCNRKDRHAKQCCTITRWQCPCPRITASTINDHRAAQNKRRDYIARIQNGVPRRKESAISLTVIMCPAIEIQPTDEPDRRKRGEPIEAGTADSL